MTTTKLSDLIRSSGGSDKPDDCEYGDCSSNPEYRVKFENPEEWVYYCHDHFHEMKEDEKAVKWDLVS